LNVFQALSHVSNLTERDHLLSVVVTILMDVSFDNLNNFDGSSIGDFPVTSMDFVVDSVTDVTNSVPISFAHLLNLSTEFSGSKELANFTTCAKLIGTELVTSVTESTTKSIEVTGKSPMLLPSKLLRLSKLTSIKIVTTTDKR
jgi:hypothetical protein